MIPVVERLVSCFDKQTETLAKELSLRGITLGQLQEIFRVPPEDPMYDSFRIEPQHAEQLQSYLLEKLDLERYDCFVDCEAIKVDEEQAEIQALK